MFGLLKDIPEDVPAGCFMFFCVSQSVIIKSGLSVIIRSKGSASEMSGTGVASLFKTRLEKI